MDSSVRLSRARQLLASLPGAYGNGHLWTLLQYADEGDLFAQVHAFVTQCAGGPAVTGPPHSIRPGTEPS